MTAQKKREILTGGFAALLIVCAVAARVITRGHRDAAYFLPVSLLRSFIYIGLMTWWGVSLWQRIVQAQVRRYLAATEAHLLTKSVLEHRKSIASKTKSWPSVSSHDFERRKTFAVEAGAPCAAA